MKTTTTTEDQNRKQALAELGKMYFHLSISQFDKNEFGIDVACLNGLLDDIEKCTAKDQNNFYYLLGFQLTQNMKTLDRIQDHWTEQFAESQVGPKNENPIKRLADVMMRMVIDNASMQVDNKRQYEERYHI